MAADAPTPDLPPSPPAASSGAKTPSPSAKWNFAAAFLGWLLPGLGHFVLGQPQRAVVLAVTIGSLWLSGLLIGGISVIDRNDHPAWFLGQMLIAPSFAANQYRVKLVREHDGTFDPEDNPPFEPAFARAQEQGTLFTSLAGLLNLLAIIDVLYRDPRDGRDAPASPQTPSPPQGVAT
ncbi:TM2 domain-containing protein [Algisphaera agarilytica]|uniref:DUF6677 domain-containing protein n=1 Tax=Algisphaera agarilytica TaxID=1385975 RepID=A0A7X0H8X1_9BACT|nr:TM2 domain-containing protein [Algisphaera agarilytica]MBB6429985.1 hypothetical protein [Algisphaera agarilytica]